MTISTVEIPTHHSRCIINAQFTGHPLNSLDWMGENGSTRTHRNFRKSNQDELLESKRDAVMINTCAERDKEPKSVEQTLASKNGTE